MSLERVRLELKVEGEWETGIAARCIKTFSKEAEALRLVGGTKGFLVTIERQDMVEKEIE